MTRGGKVREIVEKIRARGYGLVACKDEAQARSIASNFDLDVYAMTSEVKPSDPVRWFAGLGESEAKK